MFRFNRKDPKTGITYVYEQESYWVPELKQSRAKRRVVGKLDENGNIVPTHRRTPKSSSSTDSSSQEQLNKEYQLLTSKVTELEKRIGLLEKENKDLKELQVSRGKQIRKIANQLLSI